MSERRDAVRSRARQCRHADVHARAWRIHGNVRARECDGRAGVRAQDGPRRAAVEELRGEGYGEGQAVVEQVAARVLRLRGNAIRVEQAKSRAALDA